MTDTFNELELSEEYRPWGNDDRSNRERTQPIKWDNKDRRDSRQGEKFVQDQGLTEIDMPNDEIMKPAVGWLVCIRGVDKGRAFRLVKGNNSIGRPGNGKTYAVDLTDQQISRKGAAGVIVYNEKNNTFYITPGDLTTNVNPYLNDEILLSARQLNPRSVLEIADDVLLFVPFCCDKFVWKYTNKTASVEAPVQERATGRRVPQFNDDTTISTGNNTSSADSENGHTNDPDGKTIIIG